VHWHTLGSIGGRKGGLVVKSINARAALISLFLGLAAVTPSRAEDYYIYRDPDGKLAISNKEPPPGSKIIKRDSFPEITDSEVPQRQPSNNPQPNAETEGSLKPSKNQ
jgi:hypothetical protein